MIIIFDDNVGGSSDYDDDVGGSSDLYDDDDDKWFVPSSD